MKLALIIPEWGEVAGGLATYYRHLVPHLRNQGHEVHVFFGGSSVMDHSADNGQADDWVHCLQSAHYQQYLPQFEHLRALAGLDGHLAAAWGLWSQAQAFAGGKPWDLVECCDWGLGFMPWLADDTPLVVRLHASLGQIARTEKLPGQAAFQSVCSVVEQLGLYWADALVTYSNANAASWERRLGQPVSVVRPAYPVEPVSRCLDAKGLVSGKIQSWKGVEVLCQALERCPEVAIDWYGRDMPTHHQGRTRSMSQLMQQRYPNVWRTQLSAKGMVTPTELKTKRQGAAFVVVPSSWDVFNFTVVEAMAGAIPTVCSRGAGAGELISHGDNGLVFEPGDAAQLAECLQQLMAMGDDQRAAMGQAGRECVAQSLDPETQAARHIDHYQKTLDQPARQRPPSLWDALQDSMAVNSGTLDVAQNLAGRDLLRALANRGRQRLGKRQ